MAGGVERCGISQPLHGDKLGDGSQGFGQDSADEAQDILAGQDPGSRSHRQIRQGERAAVKFAVPWTYRDVQLENACIQP